MLPSWILILLFLLVILFFVLKMKVFAAAPVGTAGPGVRAGSTAVGINSVTLSITPITNPCAATSVFSCSINASGWSDDGISRNVEVRLFDDETFPDELDKDPKGTTTMGTVIGTNTGGTFAWTVAHTMNLTCTTDCEAKGATGRSGETDPQIFAKVKVVHAPTPEAESNRVQIFCKNP